MIGDDELNPQLQMGDIIKVPYKKDMVGVYGAVQQQNEYDMWTIYADTTEQAILSCYLFLDTAPEDTRVAIIPGGKCNIPAVQQMLSAAIESGRITKQFWSLCKSFAA